jgi:hypothetical protein
MNQEKSKTIIWGQLSGSVTSMIIGFTYGGGVFGSTTFSKGEEIGRVAIADRLTTMCMSKFNQDPEKKQTDRNELNGCLVRRDICKRPGMSNHIF